MKKFSEITTMNNAHILNLFIFIIIWINLLFVFYS